MTVSELIKALEAVKESNGDVEVGFLWDGPMSWAPVDDVEFKNVEDWKEPQYWPDAKPRMAVTLWNEGS